MCRILGRAVRLSVRGSRCVGALAEGAAKGKSYPFRAADQGRALCINKLYKAIKALHKDSISG